MTRTAQKIRERCIAAGLELPEEITILRTRAGKWQLEGGAWRWEIGDANGIALRPSIGSAEPATACANATKLKADRWNRWMYQDIELSIEE